jgi:exodeoxyribonuclease V alpha subunit
MPDPSDPLEHYEGVLEKILFSNEENHYMVGYMRAEGKSTTMTIAGTLPNVQCGETIDVWGTWKNHPKFGIQFAVRKFESKLPASIYGIRKYLGSGLVKGIGAAYADKIVDFFGAKTLDIISNQSARLQDVPGIGKQRAKSIKAAWDEQKIYREVMVFLQTHSVTPAQCIRLVKQYGGETIHVLKDNPYILAKDVDGIGFLTADKIAHNLGIPTNSSKRIQAGVLHSLQSASQEGHTGMDSVSLIESTCELLDLEAPLIEQAIEALTSETLVIRQEDNTLQLPNLSRWELQIATAALGIHTTASKLPPIKQTIAVDWFEEKAGFRLADAQRDAILMALQSKVSIITGGPGTGKTTLLRGIVSILKAKKVRVVLASPTGRAAKRLSEATGGYAQTVHRLLGYDASKGGFLANQDAPLKADFVILDEASMLDTFLAASLLRAIPYHAHVLLVGDIDQLPSVGAGNVLADMISSGHFPVTKLEFIYRQSKGSKISQVAHGVLENRIHPGKIVESPSEIEQQDEIVFVKCDDPEEMLEKLDSLLKKDLPRILTHQEVKASQLLVPMHKGVAGTHNLNHRVQDILNPSSKGIQIGGELYKSGDRIIQTRNNYDKNVFNGDVGIITNMDPESGTFDAIFEDIEVAYTRSESSEFQLAYAISIHKSQGSEYPVVIIPLMNQHFVMLERNLLYTGITRGKRKVIMLGQVEAYAMAVRNAKTRHRMTHLVAKLNSVKSS